MIQLIRQLIRAGMVIGLALLAGLVYMFWSYGRDLPDFAQLAQYKPPTVTRIYAGDGTLAREFASQNRVFLPIHSMPASLTQAFIAVEDQRFAHHKGIDPIALARAVIINIDNLVRGRRLIGASTITQQVAKNFLLTNEVSLSRKLREAVLALRIERVFSKTRIMELYLNEIYLGRGTYGVAAAALAYFDKSLAELEPHEMAFLAALPKAPNRYEPTRNYQAALDRRNWAIGRMMKEGYIDQKLHDAARARALQTKAPGRRELVQAPYFVEQVRIEIEQILGDQVLHDGGLYVRTSLDPILQAHATQALRQGLLRYDRRHGWRGPLAKLATDESNGPQRQAIETWLEQFASFKKPAGALDHWHLALVTAATTEHATIRLQNSRTGTIKTEDLAWARLHDPKRNRTTGAEITAATEVLTPGDLILVEALPIDLTGDRSNLFALRQIPNINGGLIAIDPHTGRILAMVGGWRYQQSQFNRAVQALRQPGSAFKPFVYLAALEQGYTPATLILDAPFVFDQGPGLKRWKPSNYTRKFYGPSPMHIGIEQSRNLMTVRLANTIGIDKIIDMAALFRIQDPMPPLLSMALGAGETSLLRLTSAYAMIVNGGKQIQPTFMDRVQDRTGKTIYQTDLRICPSCNAPRWQAQTAPELPDPRKPLVDPVHAYQIVTMLEGVVKRGTGRSIGRRLDIPLAGKTGTTNDNYDAWFIGFAPDLAVGVYTGFDRPASLGAAGGVQETGSTVAAPIFAEFMQHVFKGRMSVPFRIPDGVVIARIDTETYRLAGEDSQNVQIIPFRKGSVPQADQDPVLIGGGIIQSSDPETEGQNPEQGLY